MAETEGAGLGTCFQVNVETCPLPTNLIGELIAKIGLTGNPFAVGNSETFVADADGKLYLQINDDPAGLSDNRGILAVMVFVE